MENERKRKISCLVIEHQDLYNESARAINLLASEYLLSVNTTFTQMSQTQTDDEEEEGVLETARIKPLRISNYIEVIHGLKESQFQSHFRISRSTFEKLTPIVHDKIKKETVIGRKKMDTEKQLLATLWILATPDSYRSVSERFDMGKSSLSKAVFRVVNVLVDMASTTIKWPTRNEMVTIKNQFFNIAGVDNVIGAIDGTFIPIKAPKNDPEVYVTRKHKYAITLQAICTAKLIFTDCFVGYPGSVSDVRIFHNSDIYFDVLADRIQFFPVEEFIVGDKAYPPLRWLMSPYINRRGQMDAAKIYFNLRISQTRQTIERAFALLFGRFRRLKYLDMNRTDLIPATVLASTVLHNLCLLNNDLYIDEYIDEGILHVFGDEADAEGYNRNEVDINDGVMKRDILCRDLFHLRDN